MNITNFLTTTTQPPNTPACVQWCQENMEIVLNNFSVHIALLAGIGLTIIFLGRIFIQHSEPISKSFDTKEETIYMIGDNAILFGMFIIAGVLIYWSYLN